MLNHNSPRENFLPLDDQRRLTGRGATVLLLDNGIDPSAKLGSGFRSLSSQVRSTTIVDHSRRVASICGSPFPTHSPWGIAPEATFLSLDHREIRPEEFLETLKRLHAETAFDVVGVAWSAPATTKLALLGNHWASELNKMGVLFVTAAGHDGPGRMRMPAIWQGTLAIGVCENDSRPTTYCSRSDFFEKPEIFLQDEGIAARDDTGLISEFRGTSAAAAVVTGLAALHVEWLRENGHQSLPDLITASLLASSRIMSDGRSRILVPEWLFNEATNVLLLAGDHDTHQLSLVKDCGELGQIAIAATCKSGSSFLSFPFKLELEVNCGDQKCVVSSLAGRVVVDLPATWSGSITATIRTRGAKCSLSVVMRGATERNKRLRRTKRDAYTLGISASHHASACLLEGHEVRRAIQLERLTRHKADGDPYLRSNAHAIYCLESLGVDASEVECFAYNCQPLLPGWTGLSRPVAGRDFTLFDPWSTDSVFVSHHLAHAFAAYCSSPFLEAVVVVADGAGGGTIGAEDDLVLTGPQVVAYLDQEPRSLPGIHVTSTYAFGPTGYRLVDREYAPSFNPQCGTSSLGETYAAVSQFIFGNWLDGGKLMGLAPYGNAEAQRSLLRRDEAGRLSFSSNWKLTYALGGSRDPLEYRDLAARIQADLEDAIVDRARLAVERTGLGNIVLTGGLALNCVANERVLRESGCHDAFFFPASHDAGVSIGAAHAAVFLRTGSTRGPVKRQWSDFLGHPYDGRDYEVALEEVRSCVMIEPLSLRVVAEEIARGAIIAWFEGGSEFGPRALGHRSILASPRKRATWEYLNRRVKGREDFRPFAPVVTEEDAGSYFELADTSPYMMRVVKVREEHRATLAAVCHVNGTARVQTVGGNLPQLHALLGALKQFAHPPILLNTSLNVAGEPIVETPEEAIRFLLTRPIDALVLGDHVVRRKKPPQDELSVCSVLDLAPGTHLSEEIVGGIRHHRFKSDLPREQLVLTSAEYKVLSELDGRTSLAKGHLSFVDSQSIMITLTALWAKGYLTYHGEADK